jgi:membrane complex biogenesis BtpA family protein
MLGMVHVRALPGTPNNSLSVDEIVETALREATLLVERGCPGIIIENMHDTPYVNDVGPEIVAGMTRVGCAIRGAYPDVFMGVQILSGSNVGALAVAHTCGAQCVRVENFVFAHVADEGLMPTACAGELLRERRRVGATDVAIMADIKKKHASHAITSDITLGDAARAAEFFGADALIVTGSHTGQPTSADDLVLVRQSSSLPVLVGSGATPQTSLDLLAHADSLIVGSFLKEDGVWSNELDPGRVQRMVDAVRAARG